MRLAKIKNILIKISTPLLVIFAIWAGVAVVNSGDPDKINWAQTDRQFYFATVMSDSMVPAYHTNDFVVIKRKPTYKVGDVVMYNIDFTVANDSESQSDIKESQSGATESQSGATESQSGAEHKLDDGHGHTAEELEQQKQAQESFDDHEHTKEEIDKAQEGMTQLEIEEFEFMQGRKSMSILHRVVSIDRENNTAITKGDANDHSDAPISLSQISGAIQFKIPYIGTFLIGKNKTYTVIVLVCLLFLLTINFKGIFKKKQLQKK